MLWTIFHRTKPEYDAERNLGAVAEQEDLDFDDPSWIIDHHRRNLITKIAAPRNLSLYTRSTEELNGRNHNEDEQRRPQEPVEASNSTLSEEDKRSYRINFYELHRLHLRQLQHRLVEHVVKLRYNATEPYGWADDLRLYVQALKDYDYMTQFIRPRQDPFYVTGERYLERRMLHSAMKDKENETDPLRCEAAIGDWETADIHPEPIGGTKRQTWIKRFRDRLTVATIGGAFLIVPMWLMVLHNTLWTALVSTTLFVATFGLVMAWSLDRPMEVMSCTSAYAAVLVVFVGLTTSNDAS